MSNESDSVRNAGVAAADAEAWRGAEDLARAIAAEGKTQAFANMTIASNIGEIVNNAQNTAALFNGNVDAAAAFDLNSRFRQVTSAASDNRHIGDEYGRWRTAQAKWEERSRRDAELDAIESRIAGNPELQRQEQRRVQIGQADVLAQGAVGKSLITEQPIVAKAEEKPAATQQRKRPGFFGLDS